ncbi:hypothetical protein MKL26_07035, partial [Streptococcus suis]|nr:hypothetical protein [Streptococcus suis]
MNQKLLNLSASTLYFLGNILGPLMIVMMFLSYNIFTRLNISSPFYEICSLIIISIPLMYSWFAKKIDKVLIILFVEKIDIKKYELYWKEHIKSKLGSKVLGYHGL